MIWSLQAAPDLSDKQFDQWSKLLEDRAGICLSDQQRVFLQTQVTMRMRELGQTDYSQYYNRVVDGAHCYAHADHCYAHADHCYANADHCHAHADHCYAHADHCHAHADYCYAHARLNLA